VDYGCRKLSPYRSWIAGCQKGSQRFTDAVRHISGRGHQGASLVLSQHAASAVGRPASFVVVFDSLASGLRSSWRVLHRSFGVPPSEFGLITLAR